jgi:hypothetical protein
MLIRLPEGDSVCLIVKALAAVLADDCWCMWPEPGILLHHSNPAAQPIHRNPTLPEQPAATLPITCAFLQTAECSVGTNLLCDKLLLFVFHPTSELVKASSAGDGSSTSLFGARAAHDTRRTSISLYSLLLCSTPITTFTIPHHPHTTMTLVSAVGNLFQSIVDIISAIIHAFLAIVQTILAPIKGILSVLWCRSTPPSYSCTSSSHPHLHPVQQPTLASYSSSALQCSSIRSS